MQAFENPVTMNGSADMEGGGGSYKLAGGDLDRPLSMDFSNPGNQSNGLTFETGDSAETSSNPISKIGKQMMNSADEMTNKAMRKKNFGNSGMLQSMDVRSGKVFNEDAASFSVFSTITSPKVKEKVTGMLKEMHEHAESQQHTMTDQMNYHDILSTGILYEGEHLVDGLEPMRLTTMDMMKAEDAGFTSSTKKGDAEKETRFGIRLYLTNQRLIVVDAEPDSGSRMSANADPGKLTRAEYRLSYEIETELWYYPIPLADVKGLSLDVRTVTKSAVVLKVMRPWWSIVFGLCGFSLAIYGNLRHQGFIYTHHWGLESAILGALVMMVMAGFFVSYNSLVQGKFEPWQLQERQLRLGITDPISQAPAIFFCNMADNYTFHEATDFVHHLQHNTPQLHYGSLTNAFMQSKVASPYDRTFMTRNEDEDQKEKEKSKKEKSKKGEIEKGESIDVKLVIESPIDRIIRIKLDTAMSLAECTEIATTSAIKAGVLPKGTVIRLAIIDIEGDKCLVQKSKDMRAYLEGSKMGAVKVFAWPEFTSMPPPVAMA